MNDKYYDVLDIQKGLILKGLEKTKEKNYLTQVKIEWNQSLNHPLFNQSWEILINRYEGLRAYFKDLTTKLPKLFIAPSVKISIRSRDLTSKSRKEQRSYVSLYLDKDRQKPFNLSHPPLMRIFLIKLAPHRHTIIWTHHHAILDASSFSLIIKELSEIYQKLKTNEKIALPRTKPLKDIYTAISAVDQSKSFNYWKRLLKGMETKYTIFDNITQSTDKSSTEKITFKIDQIPFQNLLKKIARSSWTLNTVVQSSFGLLLARYSYYSDIVFGSVRAYPRALKKNCAGLFINTLPIRVTLSPNSTVTSLFDNVRTQQNFIRKYVHTPLSDIHRATSLSPHQQLFDAVIDFKEKSVNTFVLETPTASKLNVSFDLATEHPLLLEVYPDENELICQLHYKKDQFSCAWINSFCTHYKNIFIQLAKSLTQPLSSIDFLTPGEKQNLLISWNNVNKHEVKHQSITQLFQNIVSTYPNAIALEDKETKLTYLELDALSDALKSILVEKKASHEKPIGICLENIIDAITSILAVLKLGAPYLPIDPNYPSCRIRYMLDDSQVAYLISDTQYKKIIELLNIGMGDGDKVIFIDKVNLECSNKKNRLTRYSPNRTAYLIYTSGSTGKPKGVPIKHCSVVNLVIAQTKAFNITHKSRILNFASLSFDASVSEIFTTLLNGATLVLDRATADLSEASLFNILTHKKVSVVTLPPTLLKAMTPPANVHLNTLVSAGEACSDDIVKKWRPHCTTFINAYGPTEATVCTTLSKCQSEGRVSIGKPIDNVQVYVLDKNRLIQPIGAIGELYIGGIGLTEGYIHQSTLNSTVFIENPFPRLFSKKLYKSGDLVRWRPNGELEYIGREDSQTKVRGYRIELQEIAHVLKKHPQISNTVVIAYDKNKGLTNELVAYFTTRQSATLPTKNIRRHLKNYLPLYMVPSHFIQLKRIPLTVNLKTDYAALYNIASNKFAPKVIIDQTINAHPLVNIWQEIFSSPISLKDNYFELGGDSIIALQIISRAAKKGIQLSTSDIFEHPTLNDLLKTVKVNKRLSRGEKEPIRYGIKRLLSPIQSWFFDIHQGGVHHWNQSILLTFNRSIKVNDFKTITKKIVKNHAVFKQRFKKNKSQEWYLCLSQENTIVFSFHTIKNYSTPEREKVLKKLFVDDQKKLNIGQGPIIAVSWIEDNKEIKCYFTIHHLYVDAISWDILFQEIFTLFQKNVQGLHYTTKLIKPDLEYIHWVNHLSQYANSSNLNNQLKYWSNINDTCSELPVDFSVKDKYAVNVEKNSQHLNFSLSEEETTILIKRAVKYYRCTINDILIAALLITMARWRKKTAFCFDLEGHGREPIGNLSGLSNIVGWFTSIFPVSINIPSHYWKGEADKRSYKHLISSISSYMKKIPFKGSSYHILRYMFEKESCHVKKLNQLNKRQLVFNYFGQIRKKPHCHKEFSISRSKVLYSKDSLSERNYLLAINALVEDSIFNIDIGYNKKLHRSSTITTIGKNYINAIRSIIESCSQYSVTDFPLLTAYTQKDFADLYQCIINSLPKSKCFLTEVDNIYPLLPNQEGLLYHTLKEESSGNYITQVLLTLSGNINTDNIKFALQSIIDESSALRTGFFFGESFKPVQLIRKNVQLPYKEYNISHYSKQKRDIFIKKTLDDKRRNGFNIKQPPLMNVLNFKLDKHIYGICFTFHHVILDGWSLRGFIEEFISYFNSKATDVIQFQRDKKYYNNYITWILARNFNSSKRFWANELKNFNQSTRLLIEKNDSNKNQSLKRLETLHMSLKGALSREIITFAKKNNLTINTILEAAWAILLSKYSMQFNITYGVVDSGRTIPLENITELMGCFIYTVPMILSLSKTKRVIDFLRLLQTKRMRVTSHAFYPLQNIRNMLHSREMDIFNYLFIYETFSSLSRQPVCRGKCSNVRLRNIEIKEQTHYNMAMIVSGKSTISIRVLFNNHAFSVSDITRLIKQFQILLNNIITSESEPLSTLSLLTANEKKKTLSALSSKNLKKNTIIGQCNTIHALFETVANKSQHKDAILFEHERITYKALNDRANQLANFLTDLGIKRGALIAVSVHRSIESIILLFGILKSGAAYIPINISDPHIRIKQILSLSKPVFFITENAYSSTDEADHCHQVLSLKEVIKKSAYCPVVTKTKKQQSSDPAYILYTSGSTGVPKGVSLTHRNALNFIQWAKQTCSKQELSGVLAATAYTFDMSTFEIFVTLCLGGKLILVENILFIPESINKNKVTLINTVPSLVNSLLGVNGIPKSVQTIILAGEPLNRVLVEKLYQRKEIKKIYNCYGPTETGYTTYALIPKNIKNLPSIGKPIPNVQLYILDQYKQLMPQGVPGELYVSGASMASGYYKQPTLTQKSFLPNPFCSNTTRLMYKTGDLVCFENKQLYYLGRIDNQVKVQGFRIELGEIENALTEYQSIKEAAVVKASNADYLVAYIVYNKNAAVKNIDTIKTWLGKRLPSYMIPQSYIALKKLPLTQTGKLDRKALPVSEKKVPMVRNNSFANDIERVIADIWENILSSTGIKPNDDFFDVGGRSIYALKVIDKINKKFSVNVKIEDIFTYATIRSLANYISELKQKPTDSTIKHSQQPLILLQPNGDKIPLFLIHPVGGTLFCYLPLIKALGNDRPIYGIQDPGINTGKFLFRSIESMTKYYIKLIQKVRPNGPYLLAGASLGGIIAFEMAHQLETHHKAVSFLGLIDSWAIFPKKFKKDEQMFKIKLERFYNLFKNQYISNAIPQPKLWEKLHWQRLQLRLKYKAKKIHQIITLFKAKKLLDTHIHIQDIYNHWQKYSVCPIKQYLIPGDHQTMLTSKNAIVLAKFFSRVLKKLD
jgi:amino acid adenylation domain-containing protein/non-ribosomal peptide synthase protein (TIGR01720 family)